MARSNKNTPQFQYQRFKFDETKESTFEERLAAIREMGKKAQEEFPGKYQKINDWFTADYDQSYLLSFCLRYFLMNTEGKDEEAETGHLSFPPHYLEILQAIALRHKRVYSARPLWYETEKLKKDMQEVGTLIQTRMFNIPDSIKTKTEFEAYRMRIDVMSYFLAVRNWAYHHQMKQVVVDMAKLVQTEFIALHQVDPVQFVELLFKMVDVMEDRINKHLRKLRSALIHTNPYKIQEAYSAVFSTVKPSKEGMKDMWKKCGKDLINLRTMLMAHSDLRLDGLFTFSVEELVKLSGDTISSAGITSLFDKISLQFEDLADFPQEYIILDNPVHDKPFIKVEDQSYFTSLWTIIPHLTLTNLENLVAEDDALREKYTEKRSQYLEDQIEALFKRSFPTAQIFKGSLWRDTDGTQYENDLLVIINSFAIVVEAKSGNLTKPAKRGAPKRLFETIQELVEEPSTQALRFIEFFKANKVEHHFTTKRGVINDVDISKVNYFIPLGTTFYHLGAIGTNLKLLVGAGITNKKINELAPSISFTDLEVIFDILESDAEKVHYLHRRREFETQVDYFASELDLLAFYLDCGFNLGDMDNDPNLAIQMVLGSKIFDPYYVPRRNGTRGKKPTIRMTKWWSDILSQIATRRSDRWLEFSYLLLNLNESAQQDIEKQFKILVDRIRKQQVTEKHNWLIFRTASEQRHYVINVYPYRETDRAERDEMISGILGEAYENNPSAKGAIVIGVNIDKEHYPYSVVAGDMSVKLFDDQFASMSTL